MITARLLAAAQHSSSELGSAFALHINCSRNSEVTLKHLLMATAVAKAKFLNCKREAVTRCSSLQILPNLKYNYNNNGK